MGLPGIRLVVGAKAATATAPMVFYWHGTGSSSGEFTLMAGAVRSGVEAEGGVLVSFQGTTGGDALSGTSVFGRSDLELVDQLAACAVRDHNIDPRRIFTTGCSAGGLFATNLAVLRSEYIAAAAPNSGGMTFPQQFQSDYTPTASSPPPHPGPALCPAASAATARSSERNPGAGLTPSPPPRGGRLRERQHRDGSPAARVGGLFIRARAASLRAARRSRRANSRVASAG
jgi:poly(3-hydroxybutyrate) depolymerase